MRLQHMILERVYRASTHVVNACQSSLTIVSTTCQTMGANGATVGGCGCPYCDANKGPRGGRAVASGLSAFECGQQLAMIAHDHIEQDATTNRVQSSFLRPPGSAVAGYLRRARGEWGRTPLCGSMSARRRYESERVVGRVGRRAHLAQIVQAHRLQQRARVGRSAGRSASWFANHEQTFDAEAFVMASNFLMCAFSLYLLFF